VGKLHHLWWWKVGEVNWQCRQAGSSSKQSIYKDVYVLYLGNTKTRQAESKLGCLFLKVESMFGKIAKL